MKNIFLIITLIGLAACSSPPKPPTYKNAQRVPINNASFETQSNTNPVVNIGIVPS